MTNKKSLPCTPQSLQLIWLFFGILVFIGVWSAYPHELNASDPWVYSRLAHQISQSSFFESSSGGIFDHRLGVTVPVAFFYGLFGINVVTTNLWGLCATLIVIITIWTALPDTRSRLFSLVFCITSVPLFEASIDLRPDIIATAFIALSSLSLFHRTKTLTGRAGAILYPFSAVCCLFIAFLAKLSAYWAIPLWLITIISDLRDKNTDLLVRFYLPSVFIGIALGIGYLLFCKFVWGDPMARFHTVQALTGKHLWSWEHATVSDFIKRLTVSPARLFLSQYHAILLFAFFSFLTVPKAFRFWVFYTIFTVFFFWFGTTSFSRYEPMPVVTRMTLPALPGLYILASHFASRITLSSHRSLRTNSIVVFAIIVTLSSLPFLRYMSWLSWKTPAETEVMNIVRAEVNQNPDKKYLLVCSDSRSPKSLAFYFGYEYPSNLITVSLGELTHKHLSQQDKTFVFVQEVRSHFLKSAYGLEHYDEALLSLNMRRLYRRNLYGQQSIHLYEMYRPHDLADLLPPQNTLTHNPY